MIGNRFGLLLGGLALGGSSLVSPHAYAATSLADVQAAIARTHAHWVAGATSVAALPTGSYVKKLGGPMIAPHALRVKSTSGKSGVPQASTPATWDWRNVKGQNFVSPILDQGMCGSCVAFSTIGTLETQLNIAANTSKSPFELSPAYIFACGGGSCDMGWLPLSAIQFLSSTGAPDDACMPYTAGAAGVDAQCSSACSDATQRAVLITGGGQLDSSDVPDVKAALMNGPLIADMNVYDDFIYYKSGVYSHVTGDFGGGHDVSIIGWNDADQAWIVRNSWGTTWGEEGFFEIAYDDDFSGVGQRTYNLQVPNQGVFVDLALRDGTVLHGTQDLVINSQGVDGQVTWTVNQGVEQFATGAINVGQSGAFDTTKLSDGVYTITPQGLNGSTAITGQPRIAYILNGTETGAITIGQLTSGQTLSATTTFPFTISAQPVPLTLVTITLTDSKGVVQQTRWTTDTGDSMQIDLHTDEVPNGSYTLKIAGQAGTQFITPAVLSIIISN